MACRGPRSSDLLSLGHIQKLPQFCHNDSFLQLWPCLLSLTSDHDYPWLARPHQVHKVGYCKGWPLSSQSLQKERKCPLPVGVAFVI